VDGDVNGDVVALPQVSGHRGYAAASRLSNDAGLS
jgi:hypothetical protein